MPETGEITVILTENPFKRELVWDPVAAGEWTFLGGSEFDSGFRIDLNDIKQINKPVTEANGLR